MLRVKNDVTQSVYTLIIIKKTNKTLSINISWEQTSKVKYIVCFIFGMSCQRTQRNVILSNH